MKSNDKDLLNIPTLFDQKNKPDLDYRQISSFFYDQLIDAFIFFSTGKPIDWSKYPSPAYLKVLSENFKVFDINDALVMQVGRKKSGIIGMTLGDFFGRQFKYNINAWNELVTKGEVFSEFIIQKSPTSLLWVEASYRLVKNENGLTIGIIAVQRDITLRKIAFKAHEETEESLRKFTHLSFQAIAVLKEGIVIDVNMWMEKLSGYSSSELVRSKVLSDCFDRKTSKLLFSKTWIEPPGTLETIMLQRNKLRVNVQVETQVITYNGEPLHIIGIYDITSRKKIEEEIIKLSIALDQSANEIIITHKNGEIEYVNRSFTNVTGYLPSEVIGRNPRILKSGTHSQSFYKNLWKTLSKGQKWEGEFHNRKKNGELYWEQATITPIRNKESEIIRYIAIKEDISLRKKAEQSLRESEEKFRSMVSNIPGVVYRCAYDTGWTVLFISDAIENLTGFKASEMENNQYKTLKSIIHPDDFERVVHAVNNELADLKQFNIEYRILTKNKTVKWVSNSGRAVYSDEKSIKWLDGFLLDITERIYALDELKKAKISAEEANNAKSEFLANISHEIRTPLNSVLGFTELLEGLTADSVQIKYLNSIKASGKNLMMLINDLLDLSKIESGKMTLNYTFFDIRRMLDEIRNVFSLRVTIKGIGYIEKLNKNFPAEIKFDEVRLRQILINLVGNAVKFTHQGEIRIIVKALATKTREDKKLMNLEIRVIDTGIGIPENSFRLIFESFRQHSQLDSRKYEGTGLGLAITKRLVEAMEGKISVESEVGKGSTFKVVFQDVEYSEVSSNVVVSPYISEFQKKQDEKYSIREKGESDDMVILDGQVDFSSVKGMDYTLLIKRFENELTTKWKMFEKKQPLREIQTFAQDITSMGRSFKLGFIVQYGEQLLSTIENFDVEQMRIKLDFFPDLIKQLKKIGNENK